MNRHGGKFGLSADEQNGGVADPPHVSRAAREFAKLRGMTDKGADDRLRDIREDLPHIVAAYRLAKDEDGLSKFFAFCLAMLRGADPTTDVREAIRAQAQADAAEDVVRTAYFCDPSPANRSKLLGAEKVVLGRTAELVATLERAK